VRKILYVIEAAYAAPMPASPAPERRRIRELPPGVAYMPKPWKPLNVLIATERALPSRGDVPR
jgi:hypothetical protein